MKATSVTITGMYPDSSSLIGAFQNTKYGKYMPPGPHYNESERKWAISVINSIAP
jgi:hypothetical protein